MSGASRKKDTTVTECILLFCFSLIALAAAIILLIHSDSTVFKYILLAIERRNKSMLILAKGNMSIVNLSMVNNVFIGADGCSIKVNFSDGSGTQLGKYESEEAAVAALEWLGRTALLSNSRSSLFTMPSDEAVKRLLTDKANKTGMHHNIGGKKTKGHGGS